MSFEKDLEKDGVFDKLYHYLWAFSDYFKEDVARLQLNIPDTVIFENKQPLFWYYSDIKGYIKKKKTENLFLDNLKEKFLQKTSKTNIVAYFIYKSLGKEKKPTIEYFDEDTFLDFLYKNKAFPSGILQKFIDPEGVSNSIDFFLHTCDFISIGCLQAIFSDNVCLFSKRLNRNRLLNPKMDIYEKVCTFEGPDYLSEESNSFFLLSFSLRKIHDSAHKRWKVSQRTH